MMRERNDIQRLAECLAKPDPPDLRGRGMRITQPGDSTRRQTVLLPLLVRWAQYRCLAVDPVPFIASARRAQPRAARTLAFRSSADSAA